MSASIYGTLQWCTLSPEEITGIVDKLCGDTHIFKGEDFYQEVEKLGKWRPATEKDDSVIIWNNIDDAGPIEVGGKTFGLFVHYNNDDKKFDWACTYEFNR